MLNGEEVFPAEVFHHEPGDSYYVVSPQYTGYEADTEIVRGTITNDMTVTVHYTPKAYRMAIHFISEDGTEVADPAYVYAFTGDTFDVECPVVKGYRATQLRISGTSTGRDQKFTVIYVREEEAVELRNIDDYETALNLEVTYVQVGICAE